MKYRLIVLLALLFSSGAIGQNVVAFYFAAHQDDWQLFMNPSAYRDVQTPGTKVVFVYVTAGDGGAGVGTAGRSHPYYLARENGAELAVRFIADVDRNPTESRDATAVLAGHTIKQWLYGNTVSYFLRLPDGDMEGGGYRTTGFQSLKRLHDGDISSIAAVDGSATYDGWADLTATLRQLVDRERGHAPIVWLNLPDTDVSANKGDHSDHQQMATGILEATSDLPCAGKVFYLDYVLARLEENMSPSDRDVQAATFAAVAIGLNASNHPGNWDSLHRSLLGRNYFRTMPGIGRCEAGESHRPVR